MSVTVGSLDKTEHFTVAYNIFINESGGHCLVNKELPSSDGYPICDPHYPFS